MFGVGELAPKGGDGGMEPTLALFAAVMALLLALITTVKD